MKADKASITLIGIISFLLFGVIYSIIQNTLIQNAQMLVILGLSVGVIYVLFKPLKRIDGILVRVSQGDLTQKINLPNTSIFSKLCVSINRFILTTRGFIKETAIMTDKVISHCENLSSNAHIVERSAKETYLSINGISSDMSQQIHNIASAQNLLQGISAEHKMIMENGELIERMTSSMMQTVEETNRIYEALIQKMHDSAAINVQVAERTKVLNEKIYRIQSITDLVNDISKNTNLLSLNAAIEAAKAKEAGPGLSVIANEIRKLAESSSQQARQIQLVIDDIKQDISSLVITIDQEVKSIGENIAFSSKTEESLSGISGQCRRTVASIQKINQTIQAQNEQISNITQVITEVSAASVNTSAATQQVAAAADGQLKTVTEVYSSVSQLTEMNKTLKNRIESFAQNYQITASVNKEIEKGFIVLREIACSPGLATMDYEECTGILKEHVKQCPYFELFGLVQKDGLRKAITLDYPEAEVYQSFSHRPYFKAAIQGNEYQSEPYISADTNNYCIAIAVPVRNSEGEITGILMGDLILG